MYGTAPGMAVGEAFFRFSSDFEAGYGELPKSPFIANAYDATAVVGLAIEAARVKSLALTSENIRNQLRAVANPPGAFVGPGEFVKAFELLKAGQKINYEGASGSVDFDKNGDVVAPIEIWRFNDGKIGTFRMEYHAEED
jgi:ABC-type branched-subunit amino acid transport system substrate-binding protein